MNSPALFELVATVLLLIFDRPNPIGNIPDTFAPILIAVVLVLIGIVIVNINNYLTHQYRRFIRLNIALFGAVMTIVGIVFSKTPGLGAEFIGAFLCATGAQIFLWIIGIRLEILGNTTTTHSTIPNE